MQSVYIVGSSLLCALDNPANILSAKKTSIKLNILNQPHIFPYYAINNASFGQDSQRIYRIAHEVVEKAILNAQLSAAQLEETALFVGSTSFSIFISEQKYSNDLLSNPQASPIGLTAYEEITNYLCEKFLPHANSFTYHTACTSSANALLHASKMIATKKIRYAIVVGLEYFNETTVLGFHSLNLISQTQIQPFGKHRDGIILGEGCSAIVLSADKPDQANPIRIKGGATLVDIDSMTTVNPDGSSIVAVIDAAMKNTKTNKNEITAIKMHGTASHSNDDAEAIGLNQYFNHQLPPCIALKPAIGHTLGACGTNELIIFCEHLKNKALPGIPYHYEIDHQLKIPLNTEEKSCNTGTFLLNHFGFGGNNTVIVITNEKE